MKRLIAFIIILYATTPVYSQKSRNDILSRKDSLVLDKTWKRYKKAIFIKDYSVLRAMSLKYVDCYFCLKQDGNEKPLLIDNFLSKFYVNLKKGNLFNVMTKENYHPTIVYTYGYLPNVKRNKDGSHNVYLIMYNTVKPSKTWEGMQDAFEFVKIKGKFVFSGMTSIP